MKKLGGAIAALFGSPSRYGAPLHLWHGICQNDHRDAVIIAVVTTTKSKAAARRRVKAAMKRSDTVIVCIDSVIYRGPVYF